MLNLFKPGMPLVESLLLSISLGKRNRVVVAQFSHSILGCVVVKAVLLDFVQVTLLDTMLPPSRVALSVSMVGYKLFTTRLFNSIVPQRPIPVGVLVLQEAMEAVC